MNTKGKLYLIPTRLGDNPPLEVLPISIKKVIENLDYYIVENAIYIIHIFDTYCKIILLFRECATTSYISTKYSYL